MHWRDNLTKDCFFHAGDDYVLVARMPGACRLSVPADRHFLDVHLGKSEASYKIAGLEDFGGTAPPSTFIFLPAGDEREVVTSRSGWSVQIACDPSLFNLPKGEQGLNGNGNGNGIHLLGPRAICHAKDDTMIAIAQQVAGPWPQGLPPPTSRQIDSITTLLLMRVARYMTDADLHSPPTSSVSRRVQSVLSHIEENLHAPHQLEDLAAIAGVSPYHFARVFRRTIGRSPHQYVIERRLAHAKRRLNQSDDPIVEIAHDCGFASQSHMTDVFNKVLGITPGALRRNAS